MDEKNIDMSPDANKETLAAIAEGQQIMHDESATGYHSIDDLKTALEI